MSTTNSTPKQKKDWTTEIAFNVLVIGLAASLVFVIVYIILSYFG
jgi:hypothetical protein